ncbi:lamin tail domain-containing protein [Blastopirellula marina]|nr:lamin tail domain-containing protein [Blastopirellula marina]
MELLEWRLCLSAIRIVNWNTENGPNDSADDALFRTVLEAIGQENVAGNIERPSILALQETDNAQGGTNSVARVENILDNLYPSTDYAQVTTSLDGGGDATGFVFDVSAVSLLSSVTVPGSFTHDVLRAEFRPTGTFGAEDFFIYTAHLKAGTTSADEITRGNEAALIRADADRLGEGTNVIIVGDFNMKNSNEDAFFQFVAAGPGQVRDPINRLGNWNNNNSFKDIHTQNPSNSPSGGGMDDRFDLQLASAELFDGVGLEYVTGSYHAFGNNGTHLLNSGIETGAGASPAVLAALAQASDHLPVVVDYEFDDQPAGITITDTGSGTITAEGRYIDTYLVSLDTIPTADVQVTITSDGQTVLGNAGTNSITLTFTPQNAETPQTVVVQAVDDTAPEGNHVSQLTHVVSSADAEYAALAPLVFDVLVIDDEAPTVLINEVDTFDGTTGNSGQFIELYDGGIGNTSLNGLTVVLYDGATDLVYASIGLNGFTTDASGLFLLGAAAISQADLSFADGLIQSGIDAIAIYDDDVSAYPIGSPVTTQNLIDAIVYGPSSGSDAGLLPLMKSGQPLVNENENHLQASQSMSRIDDGGYARQTVTYEATTATPGQLNHPRLPGVTILGEENLVVSEAGAVDSFDIALNSRPSGDVTITLNPDADLDIGAGFGLPLILVFDDINALQTQTISIRAFDDAISEGTHSRLITLEVSSADGNYAGVELSDISVSILDDEPAPTPSIVISEIMYNPRSSEGSFSGEWVEVVNTGTATVDIGGWRLADEDASPTWGAIAAGTRLTPGEIAVLYDASFVNDQGFRAAWGISDAVQVIGVAWGELDNSPSSTNEILQLVDALGATQDVVNFDDEGAWPTDDPDGASIYLTDVLADNNVGTAWSRSTAGEANARTANGFPFSSVDVGSPGDVPEFFLPSGVTVTAAGGSTLVSEDGTQDLLSVVLDSVPTENVTVIVTPDSQLDLGKGPGASISLLFTPETAFTPQSIVVSAVDDTEFEGEHTGIISFLIDSGDPNYQSVQITDVSATISDNDTLPARVTLHGEALQYTGPGQYWFNYYVTASNGPVQITSFTLPFAFDATRVSFSGLAADFVPNAGFELSSLATLPSPPFAADYGFTASIEGITLQDQETEVLFSVLLTVDNLFVPTESTLVGAPMLEGFDAAFVQVTDETSQGIPSAEVAFDSGMLLLGDTVAPTILSVKVAGSSWSSGFLTSVDAAESEGWLLEEANQLRNLSWTNVDTIYVQFSEDIGDFTAADFALVGVNVPDYAAASMIGSVSYDSGSFVATIHLSTPFAADKVLLQIEDGVTDLAGNQLDGEWTDSVSTESGNGTAGGDFNFRFNVLPGDVNGNGIVLGDDVLAVNGKTFTFPGFPSYDPFTDIDGSGSVLGDDVLAVNGRTFTFLPGGEPVAPAPLVASLAANKLDQEEEDVWADSIDVVFEALSDETLLES